VHCHIFPRCRHEGRQGPGTGITVGRGYLQATLSRGRLAACFRTGAKRGEQSACRTEQTKDDGGVFRRVGAAGLGVKGNSDGKNECGPDEEPERVGHITPQSAIYWMGKCKVND